MTHRAKPRPHNLDPDTEVLGAGIGVQLDENGGIEYLIFLDEDDTPVCVHKDDLDKGWKDKLLKAALRTVP